MARNVSNFGGAQASHAVKILVLCRTVHELASPAAMEASTEYKLRKRNCLRRLEDRRKEQRWLNPTEAQLQQSREYLHWWHTQPEQYGDEPPNDTFELFLAMRRRM